VLLKRIHPAFVVIVCVTVGIAAQSNDQELGSNRPDNRTILGFHRDWESKCAETRLGKLSVESTDVKLKDGRDALLWKFDLPERSSDLGRSSIFLTTINENYVIVLAANAKSRNDEERVRQFLVDAIGTLKVSSKPFPLPQSP